MKGDVTYVLKRKKKKDEGSGVDYKGGAERDLSRRQRLHPFHIRAAETFIRIRQD